MIYYLQVNHPTVWNVDAWCQSFNTFLNSIQADRVSLSAALPSLYLLLFTPLIHTIPRRLTHNPL